ncbi:MAG: DUF1674 domain-containing protein [Actinomycetota bacterium]
MQARVESTILRDRKSLGGPEPTRHGDWERRGSCIDF